MEKLLDFTSFFSHPFHRDHTKKKPKRKKERKKKKRMKKFHLSASDFSLFIF